MHGAARAGIVVLLEDRLGLFGPSREFSVFMIVCICNRLSESAIRQAAGAGAVSIDHVFEQCGGQVNCGKCLDFMEEILDSAGSSLGAMAGIAGVPAE